MMENIINSVLISYDIKIQFLGQVIISKIVGNFSDCHKKLPF